MGDAALRGQIAPSRASAEAGGGGLIWLALLICAGLALRIGVAVQYPSVYHPDETFQYWEQGYRLVTGLGIVPWEYRVGVRSWIVPGLIGGVLWVVQAFGGSDAVWRVAVQSILSAASMSIVATAFLWARQLAGLGAAVLAGVVAAFWFEFIYFSPKPLTEVIAAAALFPAAYLLCARSNPGARLRALGGALLGLALVLRFHVAPAALVIGVAHLWRTPPKQWLPSIAAGTLVLLAAGALDWATWGTPFQSIWLNFQINVIDGRASTFGTEPFYWYLTHFADRWGLALAIAILALCLVGARKAPVVLIISLVLLVSHSMFAHKESRFLYPLLPFVLLLATVGATDIVALVTRRIGPWARLVVMVGVGAAVVLTSANLAVNTGFRDVFFWGPKTQGAFESVAEMGKVCGLGVEEYWAHTPGMSGLGRDLPFYWLQSPDEVGRLQSAFDVLIYDSRKWSHPGLPFLLPLCEENICIARRGGGCTPNPEASINPTLERIGQ